MLVGELDVTMVAHCAWLLRLLGFDKFASLGPLAESAAMTGLGVAHTEGY